MTNDIRVIACNIAISDSVFSPGALCYVVNGNPGWGGETSIEVYGRSRSGRWVRKWIRTRRLFNFRLKQVPPETFRYKYLKDYAWGTGYDDVQIRTWVDQFERFGHEQRERNGLQIEERK